MDSLVGELRRSGCVFAEEEAEILREAASGPAHLEEMLSRRLRGEPLEHVVGVVSFGGLSLHVGAGVFVPRQRSVHLVDAVMTVVRGIPDAVLVEAFAGVAPIASCLQAQIPGAEIHAIEADTRALVHARKNLNPGAVHAGDVLAGLPESLRGRIHVIVAVPPYVPDGRSHLLPREARDHEPAGALFGGEDGLDQVRALRDQSDYWLLSEGRLILEMHRRQADLLAIESEGSGWDCSAHQVEDEQTVVMELTRGRTHHRDLDGLRSRPPGTT